MGEWHSRIECTICGWSRETSGSSLFLAVHENCCPSCGTPVKRIGLQPWPGDPFILRRSCRQVFDGKWYLPWTWSMWHWEYKE